MVIRMNSPEAALEASKKEGKTLRKTPASTGQEHTPEPKIRQKSGPEKRHKHNQRFRKGVGGSGLATNILPKKFSSDVSPFS